jgi:hypothetical protein
MVYSNPSREFRALALRYAAAIFVIGVTVVVLAERAVRSFDAV